MSPYKSPKLVVTTHHLSLSINIYTEVHQTTVAEGTGNQLTTEKLKSHKHTLSLGLYSVSDLPLGR